MGWKTYLIMYFGTNGNSSMSEVVEKVEKLGFRSVLGPADFIYEWNGDEPDKEKIFELGNKLLEELKGSNVTFNLDTHD